ncbi:isochorismatase family protein [Methyloligella sp. 2.7D]|uniref:isochorismatase family protein n=1 Tax=unclassified Methyloligella TaxID=2625955 RepID=UPI00157C4776|nr:isochorismatase family protein [Methyloligella sp. GL2]QKP77088.1 isochorismatase family protein [Methyloligella sp. GL2]
MLLDHARSQLLIVDMQDRLLDAMTGRDDILSACDRLIRAAQILDIPVTVSEQYPKGLGPTNETLRETLGNRGEVMEKVEFSCYRNAALQARFQELRRKGRPQVILGGIESHVCVLQTAIDLAENGFETFVAADAVGSRAKESRKLALDRLAANNVGVVNTEMALFEWLGKAGTPEFKEIQALVK